MTHRVLENAAGLRVTLNGNASVARIDHDDIMLNLFRGNALEGGPTNIYLRKLVGEPAAIALLGPRSLSRLEDNASGFVLRGQWQGLSYRLSLRLAADSPSWFWHVTLSNDSSATITVDLIYTQDFGLAQYNFTRTSEFFASQYLDHTPLFDDRHGRVLAVRQNLTMGGRHPWCMVASLHRAVSYATDGLQFHGLASRTGELPSALRDGLPGMRLQHEYALASLQDAPLTLAPGQCAARGFVGHFEAHHADASSAQDLARLPSLRECEAAQAEVMQTSTTPAVALITSLFTHAPLFAAQTHPLETFTAEYGAPLIAEKRGADTLASFHAGDVHAVSRRKEQEVQRPHAQILRTGMALVPDEGALASTVFMGGIFNSLLTQGHVGINRLLSSNRGHLSQFRALGQRVFVEQNDSWQLLDQPSAWIVTPHTGRWCYRSTGLDVDVITRAREDRHHIELEIRVVRGPASRFLITHHIALDDDDGADAGAVDFSCEGGEEVMRAHAGSAVGTRFGANGFRLSALPGTVIETCGGDELLFDDGRNHDTPYVCLRTAPHTLAQFELTGELLNAAEIDTSLIGTPVGLASGFALTVPAKSEHAQAIAQWSAILPWFADNALVHYLAPRGLEQFTGGGWGSRDICQGPLEMLLALGQLAPARDLLLRVFGAQNALGDWPQWFTFFPRERDIRAGDSHGDIIFWPLMALARYLDASADLAVLDTPLPFHQDLVREGPELPNLWQHVERALSLIETQCLPATALVSYGHGDWNDSMQPADPRLREELCSAWTVTLHYQMLTTMADALERGTRATQADKLRAMATRVAADFQRLLVIDDVIPGYMHARPDGTQDYLLHPRDQHTGLHYSLLPIPHGILSGILTPAQAAHHFDLIERHLLGPDGARLFDKPMRYRGGTMALFQRAESAAFFGREIGLMYTHAHLRYAEALAYAGRAQAFLAALNLVNPVGLETRLNGASPRPSNCYYSSSDAAFPDRYAAYDDYGRVARGEIGFDGGWRVYSSGPGLVIAIMVRCLFGLRLAGEELHIDPVMPATLDGLAVSFPIAGQPSRFHFQVGAQGYGLQRVRLNGVELVGRVLHNPYRAAGLTFAMSAVRALLRATENRWEIEVR